MGSNILTIIYIYIQVDKKKRGLFNNPIKLRVIEEKYLIHSN